jgi:ABC-2 type transport system permease protein
MSVTVSHRGGPPARIAARAAWAVSDGLAAAERLLTKLRHDTTAMAMTLGAPVVLVLVFGYIFGSAIAVPGRGNYREYLVPGLFVMIAANIIPSMVTMARDAGRGVVDRFRSLPITRAAVPFGQATATALYGLANFVLMGLCGLVVGWRIHRGAGDALIALGLLVAFQIAMTWVGMYLGLLVGSEETAAQASILIFPVTGLSNVFVPTSGMPAWLRLIADWTGQRPGYRGAAPVRQPVRPGQWGVAAGAPGRRVPGVDRAAAGRLRPAVHHPLRPPVKGSSPGTKTLHHGINLV